MRSFLEWEKSRLQRLRSIDQLLNQSDVFQRLHLLIPLQELHQPDFGFQLCQMLPDAGPWSSSKSSMRVAGDIATFLSPPFGSELAWAFVVFL